MSRAYTVEQVDSITENWHAGLTTVVHLHEALGWSWEEYQRYENAVNGVSGERTGDVLASFAPPHTDERPYDDIIGINDQLPVDFKLFTLKHRSTPPGPAEPWCSWMMPTPAPTPSQPFWHTTKVAGQERWIVLARDTYTGIPRMASLPNDFATPDAAQRRADDLNNGEEDR